MSNRTKNSAQHAMRIRKGDRVIVTAGKDSGHVGQVLRVEREKERVYVEGAKIQRVSSKMRQMQASRTGSQPTGGIIEREGPIHVSNVSLIDPKDNKAVRAGVVREDGGRSRRSSRTGTKLD